MKYWQIASGDGTVDLQDIFIKLNVALIGSGHLGDFFDHRSDYLALTDGHLIRTFCEDVSVGDIFVLKRIVNPHTQEWKFKPLARSLVRTDTNRYSRALTLVKNNASQCPTMRTMRSTTAAFVNECVRSGKLSSRRVVNAVVIAVRPARCGVQDARRLCGNLSRFAKPVFDRKLIRVSEWYF